MSRPAAKVFKEYPHGRYIEQVIGCEGVFAVFYNGKPFQLRQLLSGPEAKKYGRSVFVNEAHAVRLAKRLNTQFNVMEFTVEKLL